MYGKIEWFKPTEDKHLVKPAAWQGWAYFATWALVWIVPLKMLFAIGHTPEALIWMLVSTGAFAFDFHRVSKAVRQKSEYDKLFFIGEEQDAASVSTSNYDLKID